MLVRLSSSGPQKPPVVLTVAGFDPSSGAGITADLKVFAAHGLYGVSAITALTVQSTQGVRRVETLLPEVLSETVSCLAEDLEISGIKIGMLATPGNVDVVSDFLDGSGLPRGRIVLDPVLKSSSGKELLSEDGVARLRQNLLPRVGWLTPNSEELTALTGMAARDKRTVEEAAARLMGDYAGLNLVVTGGHLDSPDDYVRLADGKAEWLAGRRIMTTSTHGTGCAFSSALLALLVLGEDPLEAAAGAKAYVSEAMAAAPGLGKGWGPLDLNAARLVHDDGENQ